MPIQERPDAREMSLALKGQIFALRRLVMILATCFGACVNDK